MRSYGAETELKALFGRNKYVYLNITRQDVKISVTLLMPAGCSMPR